jgi:hypothetical protein
MEAWLRRRLAVEDWSGRTERVQESPSGARIREKRLGSWSFPCPVAVPVSSPKSNPHRRASLRASRTPYGLHVSTSFAGQIIDDHMGSAKWAGPFARQLRPVTRHGGDTGHAWADA